MYHYHTIRNAVNLGAIGSEACLDTTMGEHWAWLDAMMEWLSHELCEDIDAKLSHEEFEWAQSVTWKAAQAAKFSS